MDSVWNKLDTRLTVTYAKYLREREDGTRNSAPRTSDRWYVLLQYTGDLSSIEPLGFEEAHIEGSGCASGAVDLSRLGEIAAHPGVVRIALGSEARPQLDRSIGQIKADKVRNLTNGVSGFTGAGVVIGIIDTGIDFRHRCFRTVAGPALHDTRILKIWDQSIDPVVAESSPLSAEIGGGTPYGVVYTADDIDAMLRGNAGVPIRHRDDEGHGTHVASIAAGAGRANFDFAGVAPEAEIIVVKYLFKDTTSVGGKTNSELRLMQAINYILNAASPVPLAAKPVVINYSGHFVLSPHDGLSLVEDFITATFDETRGRVFVVAAGNARTLRNHAQIDLPQIVGANEFEGTQTWTLDLQDTRATKKPGDLSVEIYYPPQGVKLSVDFRFAEQAAVSGPAYGASAVSGFYGDKRSFIMTHRAEDTSLLNGRGTVRRRKFTLTVSPASAAGHARGTYTLKLKYTVTAAASKRKVHAWCSYEGTNSYGFSFAAPDASDTCVISSPAGADHAITVASFETEAGAELPLASTSSSGPLADYGGPVVPPFKPDITAPGGNIDAARSRSQVTLFPPLLKIDGDTLQLSGTSMAAPHVAGAAALILDKNPNLTSTQVKGLLQLESVPYTPDPLTDRAGTGKLDIEAAIGSTPP
jgi:subtilisin family serine protease